MGYNIRTTIIAFGLIISFSGQVAASELVSNNDENIEGCNQALLNEKEAYFNQLLKVRQKSLTLVNQVVYQKAAIEYVRENERCYRSLYARGQSRDGSQAGLQIDEGGVWFGGLASASFETGEFVLNGTKWGAGSPFLGGINGEGPGISGGTVTYSFIANGVSNKAEGADSNLAISSLATFQNCFYAEISAAFAAWSAVADINFIEVSDNGLAFNATGATGDIRIGSHSFDGESEILAHAFLAPPNGNSAAGDLHFDRAENWTCNASGVDIGIVAVHEIGHSIGLDHEQTNSAIMQPFYNPSVSQPLTDDINAVVAIYGALRVGGGVSGNGTGNGSNIAPILSILLLD